jgi:hypothetical protein
MRANAQLSAIDIFMVILIFFGSASLFVLDFRWSTASALSEG